MIKDSCLADQSVKQFICRLQVRAMVGLWLEQMRCVSEWLSGFDFWLVVWLIGLAKG